MGHPWVRWRWLQRPPTSLPLHSSPSSQCHLPFLPKLFGPLSFHSQGFFVENSWLQVMFFNIFSLVPISLFSPFTHPAPCSAPLGPLCPFYSNAGAPCISLKLPHPLCLLCKLTCPDPQTRPWVARVHTTQLSCDKYELNSVWFRWSKPITRDEETGQTHTSICSCIQSRKEVVRL